MSRARNVIGHVDRNLNPSRVFISLPRKRQKRDPESHGKEEDSAKPDLQIPPSSVAFKDNICTHDFPTTCASSLLKNYTSPFRATVSTRLEHEHEIVGTTNMDEFAMGSHSINSSFDPVYNTDHTDAGQPTSAGGSSGGSAVAVAQGHCDFALGTDTGGSVRLPAAYNGVLGFKPSYGLISRFGVTAYANSLDTVGIFGRSVKSIGKAFDKLDFYDPRDPSSLLPSSRRRVQDRVQRHFDQRSRASKTKRIGVPAEYITAEMESSVRLAWIKTLHTLHERGHEIVSINLATTRLALPAYYVLSASEASSNLAKFDGLRYGEQRMRESQSQNVLFSATRGKFLGPEVQQRLLLGTFSLSAAAMGNYFIQAQKIRRLVQQDFNDKFAFRHPLLEQTNDATSSLSSDGVDFILTPTCQSLPPHLSDLEKRDSAEDYADDILTVPASLAGLPAISFPCRLRSESTINSQSLHAVDSSTTSMQVIGQFGADRPVLDFVQELESILTISDEDAKG